MPRGPARLTWTDLGDRFSSDSGLRLLQQRSPITTTRETNLAVRASRTSM